MVMEAEKKPAAGFPMVEGVNEKPEMVGVAAKGGCSHSVTVCPVAELNRGADAGRVASICV
ncbi:hypothetical protein GCM10027347_60030 [Larkinella harenae]